MGCHKMDRARLQRWDISTYLHCNSWHLAIQMSTWMSQHIFDVKNKFFWQFFGMNIISICSASFICVEYFFPILLSTVVLLHKPLSLEVHCQQVRSWMTCLCCAPLFHSKKTAANSWSMNIIWICTCWSGPTTWVEHQMSLTGKLLPRLALRNNRHLSNTKHIIDETNYQQSQSRKIHYFHRSQCVNFMTSDIERDAFHNSIVVLFDLHTV